MDIRSQNKSRTRADLIRAGMELSSKKGFSGLSLREVAQEAGITAAAFYRHFHNMEDFGLAMLDEIGLSLRQLLRDARRELGSEIDIVDDSIQVFLKFINENNNLFRLLLGERQGANPAFRKAIHAEIDRFVSELAIDLERIQIKGKMPLKDPYITSEAIVAVVFTLGAEALDIPRHKQVGLAERLVKHIKIILRGSIVRK